MARETIVPRFYGSEIEYSYSRRNTKERESKPVPIPPVDIKSNNLFLENGARSYIDLNYTLEYATPECGTVRELVAHEVAGERLIAETYLSPDRYKKDSPIPFLSLHKRASLPASMSARLSHGGNYTFGAHENYSTEIATVGSTRDITDNINGLITHFATRTIFIGTGQPVKEGYLLAQKMQSITGSVGQHPTKTLINIRNEHKNEHHAGGKTKLKRLHVICGDANISENAIAMKFLTTSLTLRLLEHKVSLNDLFLVNPVHASRYVASGIDKIDAKLQLASGKTATALDIQEELAIRAENLSKTIQLPEEELAAIKTWHSLNDSLRRYVKTGEHESELDQLDWYKKKRVLDRYKQKNGSSFEKEEKLDLLYDKIPDGLGIKLRQNHDASVIFLPSEEEKLYARKHPPEGRAKLRSEVVKATSGASRVLKVEWDHVFFKPHSAKPGIKMQYGTVDEVYDDAAISKKLKEFQEKKYYYTRQYTID